MARRHINIILELLFIFADLVLIFLLVFLLKLSADHVLFVLRSYSELDIQIQTAVVVRNAMLYTIAIMIAIVSVFAQWIIGRLRDINRAVRVIREELNGRRRKRDTSRLPITGKHVKRMGRKKVRNNRRGFITNKK